MVNGDEFLDLVHNELSNYFKNNKIYVKGKNGINSIVIFDEPELEKEKSRFRTGYSKILIFKDDKPFLAIETFSQKPTPPKDIAGPIPIYMIARKIIINKENGDNEEVLIDDNIDFNLLIVVSDQPKDGNKSAQIKDLNEKFKGVFDLGGEYSNLKNFEICEFSHMKNCLNKF